jgi:hypothetical protein
LSFDAERPALLFKLSRNPETPMIACTDAWLGSFGHCSTTKAERRPLLV